MKTRILVLLLLTALSGPFLRDTDLSASEPATPTSDHMASSLQAGPIVVDHTTTDLSQIPAYWLGKAQELAVHYAHTSHGSQITSGLQALEQADPTADYSIFYAGSTPPSTLSCDPGTLCLYDGNPPETYIEPDDYWSTESGQNRTRAVADTGLFDYSMWSWCGQQSSNSTSTVQSYLDTLVTFEQEYPDMRFILMTGHTDGGTATLLRNNDQVRQYAQDHNMILFDFADIETYAPDGSGPFYNDSEGSCEWCAAWCAAHPSDCTDLPASCAHTESQDEQKLFCKLKAGAFWWLMARLAGWEGPEQPQFDLTPSSKTAFPSQVNAGELVTYTVVVRNATGPLAQTARITDTLPAGLEYVPGTLSATSGTPSAAAAPTLSWSGLLSPTPVITITYAVTVTETAPRQITNTALIAAPDLQPLARTASFIVNAHRLYLPLVIKGVAP